MICINCGNEIYNPRVKCPHCGYRFIANTSNMCPNLVGAKCPFTGKLCGKGVSFMTCPEKIKADNESSF